MRDRHKQQVARRSHEFESFVGGAAGRLLHTATLLTAETPAHNPRARRLLTHALAQTYAAWHRLRGEDPYDHARTCLVLHFARTAWARERLRRAPATGVLAPLPPQERLVLTLRMYEGVAEEQCAALLGLPPERIGELCSHATATMLHPPRGGAPTAKAAPS